MFTTWATIMVFAIVLTIISFRNINILLSLGAFIGWMSLMAYNLEDPLVGITVGSTIHQWMTMGFIAIALAVMLMYFRNRGRVATGSRSGGGEGLAGTNPPYEPKGLMEQSPSEYKATTRKALHPRRRR